MKQSAIRKPQSAIRNGAVASFLFLFCLTGCAGPRQQIPSPIPPQEFYLQSQQKLALGNCEEAYYDYQKAVAVEPGLANATYLSNILYSWVLKQSEEADTPLLNAQKQVLLAPQQSSPRQELLSIAVDRDKDTVSAFGLGLIPSNISHPGQRRLLAREAALTDSYVWVGRLALWAKKGVKGPLDVSQTVVDARVIKEFWVAETIYVVKVKAPLSKNSP